MNDSGLTLSAIVLDPAELFAALAGLGQLAIAGDEDLQVPTFEAVPGCDVTDGTVQADVVVIGDELGHDAAGLVEGQRHLDANAVAFHRFVPAFDLTVRLRVVAGGPDVGHAGAADVLLEVLGNELRSVVGDDARRDAGIGLAGALDDSFHVDFLHFLADFAVDDQAAAAVENGTHEIKGAGDVDVTDIHVPVLVRFERLHEASAFFTGRRRLAGQQSGAFE